MMLMRTAGLRVGARALAPPTPAAAAGPASLLLTARRAAAASPFAHSVSRLAARQPGAAPTIRFVALYQHSASTRVASQRRTATIARFSTSPSTPASGSSSVADAATEKSLTHFERLKDLWNKYGIVAIGTYLSMYGVVLGSIYVAIDQGWVNTAKPPRDSSNAKDGSNGDDATDEFNLVTATNKFVTFAEDLGIAKYLEVEHVNAKTGTFLIAWIATKFTEPVRLAVTLAITPRIARFFGRAPQLKPKVRKP